MTRPREVDGDRLAEHRPQYHTATLLANGQVLVAGGIGNSGMLTSAECMIRPAGRGR